MQAAWARTKQISPGPRPSQAWSTCCMTARSKILISIQGISIPNPPMFSLQRQGRRAGSAKIAINTHRCMKRQSQTIDNKRTSLGSTLRLRTSLPLLLAPCPHLKRSKTKKTHSRCRLRHFLPQKEQVRPAAECLRLQQRQCPFLSGGAPAATLRSKRTHPDLTA